MKREIIKINFSCGVISTTTKKSCANKVLIKCLLVYQKANFFSEDHV